MSRRRSSFGAHLLGLTAAIGAGVVVMPLLLAHVGWRRLQRARIRRQLHRHWPAHVSAVLVYSQSARWAPAIERELLPLLGTRCIAIDRSGEPDWKRRYAPEIRAVELWHGDPARQAVVLLLPRAGQPQSVALPSADGSDAPAWQAMLDALRRHLDDDGH